MPKFQTNKSRTPQKVGDTVRVNLRTRVNNDMITHEKRDGRDVIIVKSATLPDDVVMNGILYPAEEIEKSYKTLEGTPAPFNHPTVNGMFVSAKSPLGLNIGYFGAFNANVRREGGRVHIDKVIDVKRANESEMGKRVLAALDEGQPVHTSTGLTLQLRECTNSDLAEFEGFDMEFDHDAILLDEEGAATPEQGVGMMVNSKGEKITVINSDVEDYIEQDIDMLGMELMRAMDRKRDVFRWERIKAAIAEFFSDGSEPEDVPTNKETIDMDNEELEKRFGAIDQSVAAINTVVQSLTETLTAVNDKLDNVTTTINAEAEAKKAELVNQVVKAELMSEDDAKALPSATLEAVINASKPRNNAAPGLNAAFNGGGNTTNVEAFNPLGQSKKEA